MSSADKKTITDAFEQQLKWLDANANAKLDELRVHRKQLEQVVIRTITSATGQDFDANSTRSNANKYEGEL
jgi:hydrogenase maturation factor HypF (carbamoyltransferase family)